ncbi:hypothetical protein FB451DRAFT_967343, partial [Mycena latifolia]
LTMAHIAYPSTPSFTNFRTTYVRAIDRPPSSESSGSTAQTRLPPPTKATFFGTVKLHGTNATLVFRPGDKGNPQIQARTWVIESAAKDNMGTFTLLSAAPLASLVDQILAVRGQGSEFEEIYVCGEVAGKGIQKGVAIAAMERFFAIFNIRIDGRWVDMRQYKSCNLPEYRIYNVAQYRTFEVDIDFRASTAAVYERMKAYTAEVCDACPFGAAFDAAGARVTGGGEGIVWTMVRTPFMDEGSDRAFDDTLLVNFKTKGKLFESTFQAPKPSTPASGAAAAAQFAEYALGERRFEQGVEYLEGEQARAGAPVGGYDVRLTGAFIKWVADDAIKEEREEMERLGAPERDAR